ncbi:MAG: transcription antitermination factor NusB [Lacisediminihabitans sp.]|uniref:Transcription antitermination protein NusB n=1 Tax=Lacisediminihabitans changchengi TaxID=2787634 RepID=A0A934W4A7_9MICO|nr:transcription antitermination factor NusB [Lacisediminihabitans changchengi]MBK4346783.1 transcription antitermination factor NusB [Lacisediminihabitans changchengi]MBK4348094.1 transcription antitermination factor NusB [Lacisediminihabitans changchengi]
MSARTKARKRAIDLLYGADLREISLNQAIEMEAERAKADPNRWNSWIYARQIVEGIAEHGDEIDELIETYAQGWTINRMPVTDRAIIRIGIWEILFNDEVPDGVAIDEAVEAAKSLSTDDSGSFVNGLLGRIAQTRA